MKFPAPLLLLSFLFYASLSVASVTVRETLKPSICAQLLASGKRALSNLSDWPVPSSSMRRQKFISHPPDISYRFEITHLGTSVEIALGPSFKSVIEDDRLKIYARNLKTYGSQLESVSAEIAAFRSFNIAHGLSQLSGRQTIIFNNLKVKKSKKSFARQEDWDDFDEAILSYSDDEGRSVLIVPQSPDQAAEKILVDRSLLFGELFKLDLAATFGAGQNLMRIQPLKIALGDFAAANFLESSQVGSSRQIDRLPAFNAFQSAVEDPYRASLYFSSVLWKLRMMIGSSGVRQIFYPFLVYLNLDLETIPQGSDFDDEILEIRLQFVKTLIETVESMYGPLTDPQKAELVQIAPN